MSSATSVAVDGSPYIGVKQMQPNAAIKYWLVEFVIPANSPNNQFTFNTENFLRMKQVISIETFTVNDMATSPLANPLVTSANAANMYFNFYGTDPDNANSKGEWLEPMPFCVLHRVQNSAGDPFVRDQPLFVPRNIVWEKSEFFTTQTGANPFGNGGTAISVILLVGYLGTLGD